MTDSERDRLVKIEAILPAIQNAMSKILESQESITVLKITAEEQREFMKSFEDEVSKLIAQELHTIRFSAQLDEQIDKRVDVIFNKEETRKSFEKKVNEIIEEKIDKANSKLLMKIGGFLLVTTGAIIAGFIKGVFGV